MSRTNQKYADTGCRIYYLLRIAAGFAAVLGLIHSGPVLPAVGALVLILLSLTPYADLFLKKLSVSDDDDRKAVLGGLRRIGGLFLLILFFIFISERVRFFDAELLTGAGAVGILVLAAGSMAVSVVDSLSLEAVFSGKAVDISNAGRKPASARQNQAAGPESFSSFSGSFLKTFAVLPIRFILLILVGVYAFSVEGVILFSDLFVLSRLTALLMSPPFAGLLFFSIVACLVSSLIEMMRLPARAVSVLSGTFLAGLLLFLTGYAVTVNDILFTFAFSLILGITAYVIRIGDFSAFLSATLLGFLIVLYSSVAWYVLLLTFFILGGAVTKYKYHHKEKMGLAEGKKGVRNYENVLANSLPALFWAIAYGVSFSGSGLEGLAVPLAFAYVGTVSNALGDTMASEIGTTSKGPTYMITTLRKAKAGEDGGISLLGELACLCGALIIGLLAWAFGIIASLPLSLIVSVAGGFLGTNIDSFLGATLQKKGYLSNSGVNLLSTAISGFPAAAVYFLL